MSIRLSDLWRWDGRVERVPYLILGAGLLVIKGALDWTVANLLFGRDWYPFHYLVLPHKAARIDRLDFNDRIFYGALLLLALPFIWSGVALTLRRLRAIGLPSALVWLFFVPLVNLLFFLVLCVLSSQPQEPEPTTPRLRRLRELHARIASGSAAMHAAVALVFTVPLGLGLTLLSVSLLENYGWALFVGLPFGLGMTSVLLYGFQQPRDLGSCVLVSFLSIAFLGAGLLAIAFEGFICLLMAAPIGLVLGLMGGFVGYAVQLRPWSAGEAPYLLVALMLALPALMAAEYSSDPQPELLEVTSVVEIDAPPEEVWRHVVSFTELPEPDDWFFQSGVAYPMRAEIHGRGPGAVRHCVFSTGPFVEPITIWDEPRVLEFTVQDQPPPMKEWSPYDIHPPHLDHYLVSQKGRFRLTPLPDGRTRLEGTTWYTNKMWPAVYWQQWSDWVIHRIHMRVLDHVKNLAERPANGETGQ
jgi:uncharacterized membrane protein YhaH (DUF805 family)